MRYSKWFSKLALAGLALAGASILPAADWRDGYNDRQDLRHDYASVARMRAEVARDRARLDEDIRCGRRGAVERDRAELYRDQRALDAMMRDARYDRNDLRSDYRDRSFDYGRR